MKQKYVIGVSMGCVLAIVAVVYALGSQREYVTFHDAAASGDLVQVRGKWVKDLGSSYDPSENLFKFTMKDEDGKTMEVQYADAKPNNFELAEEVVVGGRVENGTFVATSLLTKCPSKYEAKSIDTEA